MDKQYDHDDSNLINPPTKIPTIVKVLSFMIMLVLVFTGISNLLPQVEGQAPKDIKVDLGALTMESYIAMGETLFKGKGTCTLCHNNLGRAPDILAINMEETAAERLASDDYKGDAKDSENYFFESMVDPSKYVVPGYGKPGEPSPMPTIDKAPIGLTKVEMGAVIAFMQAKDGGEPTVELPTDAPAVEEKATSAEPPKPAANAQEVLTKNGCTACHAVLDSVSTIGPDLRNIGARSSREAIRESIINPAAVIAEGFPPIMPATFTDTMRVKELEMVVDYLFASKGHESKDDMPSEEASKTLKETEKKGE
ncbi:MAG: c-type cytochrome [Gammaproteobacteria bacterium]|nr:c-type cytochrome [Gammaproteobacteria bacterium]